MLQKKKKRNSFDLKKGRCEATSTNLQYRLVRIKIREAKSGSCPDEAKAQAGLPSPIALSLRKQFDELGARLDPPKTKRGLIMRPILLPEGRY